MEEAWTKGNSWVVVGWMKAHHSGISMAVVLGGATVLDRWQGRGARGTGRRVVGCSGEPIAGVGRARGRLVRAVDGRCSVAGE
jgi:hypothetical protein